MHGLRQLVQAKLQMPVRVGLPRYYFAEGLDQSSVPEVLRSPLYATAYGLLAFGLKDNTALWRSSAAEPLLARVVQRMKTWIYDFI